MVTLNTKGLFEDDHDLVKHLKVEHDAAHGLDIEVQFTIEEINLREPADLDQELFDKLFGKDAVKTVTELRDKLKEDAEKQFDPNRSGSLRNLVRKRAHSQRNSYPVIRNRASTSSSHRCRCLHNSYRSPRSYVFYPYLRRLESPHFAASRIGQNCLHQ